MKTLPPVPSQLDLIPQRNDLGLSVVEPSARREILRALAEVLLAAVETVQQREVRDEKAVDLPASVLDRRANRVTFASPR